MTKVLALAEAMQHIAHMVGGRYMRAHVGMMVVLCDSPGLSKCGLKCEPVGAKPVDVHWLELHMQDS